MRDEFRSHQRSFKQRHPGRPGTAVRYPGALQRRAAAFTRERRSQGAELAAIAEELGVGIGTLRRWLGQYPAAFRKVQVVPVPTPPSRISGSAVLLTPQGFRVE